MPTTSKLVPGFLLLMLAAGSAAVAQEEAEGDAKTLHEEILELKAGQAAIRRELAQIRSLVQQGAQRPAAAREPEVPDVTIDLTGYPVVGQADAPVTVVEFADFQ